MVAALRAPLVWWKAHWPQLLDVGGIQMAKLPCYICILMCFSKAYFFAHFWFSHRTGGGEAGA